MVELEKILRDNKVVLTYVSSFNFCKQEGIFKFWIKIDHDDKTYISASSKMYNLDVSYVTSFNIYKSKGSHIVYYDYPLSMYKIYISNDTKLIDYLLSSDISTRQIGLRFLKHKDNLYGKNIPKL